MTRLQRRAICAAALTALAGLSGCAADGIEFNGKIFDALGMKDSRATEVHLYKRLDRANPRLDVLLWQAKEN